MRPSISYKKESRAGHSKKHAAHAYGGGARAGRAIIESPFVQTASAQNSRTGRGNLKGNSGGIHYARAAGAKAPIATKPRVPGYYFSRRARGAGGKCAQPCRTLFGRGGCVRVGRANLATRGPADGVCQVAGGRREAKFGPARAQQRYVDAQTARDHVDACFQASLAGIDLAKCRKPARPGAGG